ncbi:MAG: thioredoxin [Actinobacteria bacterium]|nr:thioredoxin [Actinomycetota bacterium]
MHNSIPILIIFALATAYGIWYQRSRGRLQSSHPGEKSKNRNHENLTAELIGTDLGSRATFLQFSSAFCTPCRATRALLTDITADLDDVTHVDIDAEKSLDLVRKLDIRSTPTTLILDRNGKEIGRAVGAPKRSDIIRVLENIS